MLYILCTNCGYETNYYDNLVDAIKEIIHGGGYFHGDNDIDTNYYDNLVDAIKEIIHGGGYFHGDNDIDTMCPFCKFNTLVVI